MNRLSITLFLLIFIGIPSFSQNTIKVTTSYTYYAPETMSVENAKRIALDRAQIQAIADNFGSFVSQNSSTIVSNINGQSDTQYYSIGGTDVKGEWIETIGEPQFEIQFENHFFIIKCTVSGTIRETLDIAVDFDVHVLCNGIDIKNERSVFKDGDDMYVSFQSPYHGFLSMYWVDFSQDKAYRILPYQSSNISLLHIKKDTSYIFFSKDSQSENDKQQVDEFSLTCNSKFEKNLLYVIFSEKEYSIPITNISEENIKYLTLESFQKWISNLKRKNNSIRIKSIELTLTNQ